MHAKESRRGHSGIHRQTYSATRVTLFFLMENEQGIVVLPKCLPKQMENISCSLSAAIISFLFAGAAVSQPITVNIYTLFSFPFAVFLSHRICSRSLTRYLFLFSIHYTPSIFSAHINLTPHSK